jgi:hypothetical protein
MPTRGLECRDCGDYYPAFGLALRAAVANASGVQCGQTGALVGTSCLTLH